MKVNTIKFQNNYKSLNLRKDNTGCANYPNLNLKTGKDSFVKRNDISFGHIFESYGRADFYNTKYKSDDSLLKKLQENQPFGSCEPYSCNKSLYFNCLDMLASGRAEMVEPYFKNVVLGFKNPPVKKYIETWGHPSDPIIERYIFNKKHIDADDYNKMKTFPAELRTCKSDKSLAYFISSLEFEFQVPDKVTTYAWANYELKMDNSMKALAIGRNKFLEHAMSNAKNRTLSEIMDENPLYEEFLENLSFILDIDKNVPLDDAAIKTLLSDEHEIIVGDETFKISKYNLFQINSANKILDKKIDELIKEGRIGELKEQLPNIEKKDELMNQEIKIAVDELIKEKRFWEIPKKESEIRSRYSQSVETISNRLNDLGLDENGDYREIKISFPNLTDIQELQDKSKEIDASILKRQEEAIQNAKKYVDKWSSNGKERAIRATFTLGISEIIRHMKYKKEQKHNLKNLNAEIANERQQLADEVENKIKSNKEKLKKTEDIIYKLQNFEKKEEKIKESLKLGLIKKINGLYRGLPVEEMPNCVMFVGENPYLAKKYSKWVADSTDTDYVFVQSKKNNDEMQKDIHLGLEASEENYKKTGNRTIMFVEGMDKLLKSKTNSKANIAWMKDIMQCASEKYHTTIMFSGVNPRKYGTGINMKEKIGLKVPVDISIEEANIQKLINEIN